MGVTVLKKTTNRFSSPGALGSALIHKSCSFNFQKVGNSFCSQNYNNVRKDITNGLPKAKTDGFTPPTASHLHSGFLYRRPSTP